MVRTADTIVLMATKTRQKYKESKKCGLQIYNTGTLSCLSMLYNRFLHRKLKENRVNSYKVTTTESN